MLFKTTLDKMTSEQRERYVDLLGYSLNSHKDLCEKQAAMIRGLRTLLDNALDITRPLVEVNTCSTKLNEFESFINKQYPYRFDDILEQGEHEVEEPVEAIEVSDHGN